MNKLTTQPVTGPLNHVYFRYMMDTPETLKEQLDPTKPLMLDVETHRKDYSGVRTVQLYQEDWPQVLIFDTNITPVKDIYEVIKDMHIVSHLSTMELSCFQNELKPDNVSWKDYSPHNPFKYFSDTFLLARQELYDQTDSFSLDKVAAIVHNKDYYKDYAAMLGLSSKDIEGYKKYMQKSFLDTPKSDKKNQPLVEEQLVYAAIDVLVMPLIYNKFKHREKDFIIVLDYKFIDHCTRYQFVGLPLDVQKWREQMEEQNKIIAESQDFLPDGFNPRSYKQVRALLNSTASDDTFLAQVMDGSDICADGSPADAYYADDPDYGEYRKEVAKHIRAYRSAVKRQEYLKAYYEQYEKYGRVKGFISPRTISGRIASDEINMTNIPRSLKGLFGVDKTSSTKLIYADYSQLELRMLAAVLNEHSMIEKFMNDEDLHVFAGSRIYSKKPEDVSYQERFIGKFFNFSASYGAGVARLCSMLIKQAGIYMSEDEMRPLHKKWKALWPQMANWHRQNARSHTNIDTTLSGRKYKAKIYTDLNAIKMQGSAAEVFKLAHLYMARNYPNIPIGAAIHDSFVTVTDKDYELLMVTKAWCMVVAWFEVIKQAAYPRLSMPTDVFLGHNWGAIDNDDEYDSVYKIAGTYEQYLKAKDIVISGAISSNISALKAL